MCVRRPDVRDIHLANRELVRGPNDKRRGNSELHEGSFPSGNQVGKEKMEGKGLGKFISEESVKTTTIIRGKRGIILKGLLRVSGSQGSGLEKEEKRQRLPYGKKRKTRERGMP